MGEYRSAQICLNGHVITEDTTYTELKSKYCKKCGQPTIEKCPSCGTMIRGEYYVSGYLGSSDYEIPAFCHACGKPYPWTQVFLKSADEIVDLLDDLKPEQQRVLKETFPDLIVETPKSHVQALIAAKIIHETKSFGKDVLISLIKDHAVATLVKLMGL